MDMKAHQEELKAHRQILRCDLHPYPNHQI